MNGGWYQKLALVLRYLLAPAGVAIALRALVMTVRDCRAQRRLNRTDSVGNAAEIAAFELKTGRLIGKYIVGRCGSVGSSANNDAVISKYRTARRLFDFEIGPDGIVIYKCSTARLRLNRSKDAGSPESITVQPGQRFAAGNAMFEIKPYGASGRAISPVNKRLLKSSGRKLSSSAPRRKSERRKGGRK